MGGISSQSTSKAGTSHSPITMKVLAVLIISAAIILGEMSANAYILNRRSYDAMQQENAENIRQKRLAMTLKDAELIKDMLVAEKLASSIMTDVQSVLREFSKKITTLL